jgi:hypothetical protein
MSLAISCSERERERQERDGCYKLQGEVREKWIKVYFKDIL